MPPLIAFLLFFPSWRSLPAQSAQPRHLTRLKRTFAPAVPWSAVQMPRTIAGTLTSATPGRDALDPDCVEEAPYKTRSSTDRQRKDWDVGQNLAFRSQMRKRLWRTLSLQVFEPPGAEISTRFRFEGLLR